MYARTVADPAGGERVLTFGVSGKLIMNVLVMYDHETDSLWSQILGEAVEGLLTGSRLRPLAALQTTWGQWKALHPDTLALATNGMGRYDSYSGYFQSNRAGVLGESRQDERIEIKELVTGVVIDGQAAAYPHRTLAREPLLHDEVNGVALLVVFDPATAASLVFERMVDGRLLTFAPDPDEPEMFVDRETGSRWQKLTGTAFAGPLAGTALTRVPSTSSFWFGWKDWHPQTLVYLP